MVDLLKKIAESEKNLFVGIAGPGTGKSHTFGEIIKSPEFNGKKILILSFINKLVDDLTRDFQNYDNVTVSTLHSFAKKQIGDVDLDQNLDQIISEDYSFLRDQHVNFETKFQEVTLSNDEIEFYKARKEYYKHVRLLYSFNSIVYAANRLFEKSEENIPQKYELILIDEFQDFNKCEYEFIRHLNKKTKVILVGDENQSLYLFKKAKPNQIIDLYNSDESEEFSLDNCYRCTEVIVNASNDLVANAKKIGLLKNDLNKKFLYPGTDPKKNEASQKYDKIDFMPAIQGDLLIYKLSNDIKENLYDEESKQYLKRRVLIVVPSFYKQSIYDGLVGKGFNVVEFELFGEEQNNNFKHRDLIEIFKKLTERKTDNLALRKVLPLYFNSDEIRELIIEGEKKNKKIWSLLSREKKAEIEADVLLYRKILKGVEHLQEEELKRFNKIFTLKNLFSKMIKGFKPVEKNAIEIEMTTVMSSKGLSADLVYYVGIDDQNMIDRDLGKFTDQNICEFLVGITRAKEKLTLISFRDKNPKILNLIDKNKINRIEFGD